MKISTNTSGIIGTSADEYVRSVKRQSRLQTNFLNIISHLAINILNNHHYYTNLFTKIVIVTLTDATRFYFLSVETNL